MQVHARPAILLPEEPFGVQLLRREHEWQEKPAPGAKGGHRWRLGEVGGRGDHAPDHSSAESGRIKLYVREGAAVPGGDACAEEVAVLGNRVAWTSGSCVRKLFTLGAEVLQTTWAVFPGYSSDPVLCLLGADSCLTTCTLGGELQESAVPPGLDAVWAAGDCGVLLGGPLAATLYLLSHPMDEPQPVVADVSLRARRQGSYAGWSGEQVVWSSYELPYLATYSEAAGRLAIWTVGRAPLVPELLGNLPDIPAATPLGGGAPPSLAGGLTTGPGGGGAGGAPPTGMSVATAATPLSMMSMFSFQPLGGGGQAAAAAAAAPAAAAAAPPVGGGGLFTAAGQQYPPPAQHQQPTPPTPYCPPSAAPSDMAISPATTTAAATATPPTPLMNHHQQQQQLPSPHYSNLPSASPSDMSIGYSPVDLRSDTPQSRQALPPPPPPQQQQQQPSPICPPSAAPSDMSMAMSMSMASAFTAPRGGAAGGFGAATPAAPGAAAAAAGAAAGAPGGAADRFYHSPYGGAAGTPMLTSPWMPASSPGPGFAGGGGGGGGPVPGTALKRYGSLTPALGLAVWSYSLL
ncbi:hypothetical protein PLESTM_000327300 [Pleodorina starrii]|nr:hypothetical protein PLESTM_000327300 [Pleodorina starrii]